MHTQQIPIFASFTGVIDYGEATLLPDPKPTEQQPEHQVSPRSGKSAAIRALTFHGRMVKCPRKSHVYRQDLVKQSLTWEQDRSPSIEIWIVRNLCMTCMSGIRQSFLIC